MALGAVLTPALAHAADGEPLVAGALNGSSHTTVLGMAGAGDGASALRTLADGANFGVTGESVRGTGVQGIAHSAGTSGVYGVNSSTGAGVTGQSDGPDGIGVLARSSAGTALRVQGKLSLGRSGILRIPAGHRSFTQTGVNLSPNSMIVATVQRFRRDVWIMAADPDAVSDAFTVTLNRAPRRQTPVAWFVLN
jgi:hypothetical protein